MDNFFETYVDWLIQKINDGDDIYDIINSGYTESIGNYYCPVECPYLFSSANEFYKYLENVGYGAISGCCFNFLGNMNLYLNLQEVIDNKDLNYCCPVDKFCLETQLTIEVMLFLIGEGIFELSSSSEIYNTNLCYLSEQLFGSFETSVAEEILVNLLDMGIMIFCDGGNIRVLSVENYLMYWMLG
jgi:hypothetical protein